MNDLTFILPGVALLISIGGILLQYFGVISGIKERLTRLETKTDLFWKVIEDNITTLLKSPTHLEKDVLLDKLTEHQLSLSDAERLRAILRDEIKGGQNNNVLAYTLILARLEQLLYDLRNKK